jgi:hypothetical protein
MSSDERIWLESYYVTEEYQAWTETVTYDGGYEFVEFVGWRCINVYVI